MSKRAYYIEYPDKGFASILKEDAEDSVIWTAEEPDSDAHIAFLKQDGYEVIHFISTAYERKEIGRTRRTWHNIQAGGDRTEEFLRSFRENKETWSRWEKEDEEAYPDYEERRKRIMAIGQVVEDVADLVKNATR